VTVPAWALCLALLGALAVGVLIGAMLAVTTDAARDELARGALEDELAATRDELERARMAADPRRWPAA
jgi:uncharacterized membrane-anchored protein YhcB (DUF1043 family)